MKQPRRVSGIGYSSTEKQEMHTRREDRRVLAMQLLIPARQPPEHGHDSHALERLKAEESKLNEQNIFT